MNGSYLDTYSQHLGRHHPLVWAVHPYSDIGAFENADENGHPGPNPALSGTLVGRFAEDLSRVGYHQGTQIWLDEVSAFQYHDMNSDVHHKPIPKPGWNPKVQAAAGHYLLTELPKAAGGPREPTVTRAYYLNSQSSDTTNSRWALVLKGGLVHKPHQQHLGPQPLYCTFVTRAGNPVTDRPNDFATVCPSAHGAGRDFDHPASVHCDVTKTGTNGAAINLPGGKTYCLKDLHQVGAVNVAPTGGLVVTSGSVINGAVTLTGGKVFTFCSAPPWGAPSAPRRVPDSS